MSLFLDSNVVLWWVDNERLPAAVVERIRFEPTVLVSLVTPWELWIKVASGKLALSRKFEEGLVAQDAFTLIPPTLEDARLAANLPPLHKDPFDRMIVAQALNRHATLITGDRGLGGYGVDLIEV